jgi:hypothetical protein
MYDRTWPFASVVKTRFGAARVDRLLSADEIIDPSGAALLKIELHR